MTEAYAASRQLSKIMLFFSPGSARDLSELYRVGRRKTNGRREIMAVFTYTSVIRKGIYQEVSGIHTSTMI